MSVDVTVAEHEAAHVVVGLALGLKLRKVSLGSYEHGGEAIHGFTWFRGNDVDHRLALGVMYAAGVAWEASLTGKSAGRTYAVIDRELAQSMLQSRHSFRTGVRIADEILRARRRAFRRVVRELCDRDLGPRDVEALVLG